MERVDEAPGVAAGYQDPDVKLYDLDEETLRRVIDHDEEVAELIVSCGLFFIAGGEIHAHHWAAANTVGNAVGDSRHLRKLIIQGFLDGNDNWLSEFLRGLARNRSIEHLAIDECYFSYDPIEIISPFFMHNRNLRCIHINWCNLSEYFPSFLLALSTCETNQLERIHLEDNNLEEEQVTRIMKALHKQRNLRGICVKEKKLFRSGFVELSRLLQHPHSKIHSLEIGDRYDYYPLVDDWRVFSAVLCSPICSLENLTLHGLNDEGATVIGDSLAKKNTLNSLKLSTSIRITSAGWKGLLKCLRNPTCALRELDVDVLRMGNAGAIVIARSLKANASLKILKMDVLSMTATGWVEFFNRMLDSACSLEELHLAGIEDRGAAALVNLLASMSTLQLLKLRRCHPFTTNVRCAFARVLQNGSTVKTLDIEGSNLDEEAAIDFATALESNSCLSKLRICGRVFTDRVWGAFDRILDASCIESTYLSNHTLHTLEIDCWDGRMHRMVVPEELDRVLRRCGHPSIFCNDSA
jgi:hypothetical protein